MDTMTLLSREEVAARAQALYVRRIHRRVETEENVGRMVIIDAETGDYEVDDQGSDAVRRLRMRHPDAQLYGIMVGYRTMVSFCAAQERTGP